jgi:hypothetical protein
LNQFNDTSDLGRKHGQPRLDDLSRCSGQSKFTKKNLTPSMTEQRFTERPAINSRKDFDPFKTGPVTETSVEKINPIQ